ncbi:hypothetical protein A9Q77_03885 [Marinomonas sp. 42_23_T18]|nr:hypothetical protein A9Q77_03885 [Marinomonas sp. 42_23_T18]
MIYLIITDIFGLCEATDRLTEQLECLGHQVEVCDPYQGDYRNMLNADEAYHAFVSCLGHEAFYQKSFAYVKALKPDVVLGFSAGASAAWRLSAQDGLSLSQVICFYPSQIRHFSELVPSIPCRLILPNFETSFDVEAMANRLTKHSQLEVIKSEYGHGFMNPKSEHYDEQAQVSGFAYIDN